MPRSLDILIFTHYFYPELVGSAPPLTDLARFSATSGHNTTVLTSRPSYPARRVMEGYRKGEKDKEVWEGIDVHRVNSFVAKGTGIASRLLTEGSFVLKSLYALLSGRIARKEAVLVVCPSILAVAVAPLFVKKGGKCSVIVHDIQSGLGAAVLEGKASMKLLRWLERWSLNRIDQIITLSQAMENELRILGVYKPIEVLPPQVDVNEIVPMPESDGTFTVLYSGAFGKKQGLHQLLDCAEELKRRKSPVRLVLRGEGGIIDELKDRIHQSDLTNIEVQPLVPRDQISKALGEGHIHVVPQAAAGGAFAVPSKIFSIMSASRPILATAEPESPLGKILHQSECGIIVPTSDPVRMADAICDLRADAQIRLSLGQAGRRFVETNVDRSVICPKILSLMS